MTVWLTQVEADALFAMETHRVDEQRRHLPDTGGGIVLPLASADGDEPFHLNISRERIHLAKSKIQNHAGATMALALIDTKDKYPEISKPLSFLNDKEKTIAGSVTDALQNYGVTPVARSQRDQFRERLVA